jgi:hypothetical protein
MRTRVTVLTSVAAVTLALGILVFAVLLRPSTELIEGTVVAVAPAQLAVVIHAGTGDESGRNVIVHLTAGQQVHAQSGPEALSLVRAGQRIEARVRSGSFKARWIAVYGPGFPADPNLQRRENHSAPVGTA